MKTPWLTSDQAAAYVHLSRSGLRSAVLRGRREEGPPLEADGGSPRRPMYLKETLDTWVRARARWGRDGARSETQRVDEDGLPWSEEAASERQGGAGEAALPGPGPRAERTHGGSIRCNDCDAVRHPNGSGLYGFAFRCGREEAPSMPRGATLGECLLVALGHPVPRRPKGDADAE